MWIINVYTGDIHIPFLHIFSGIGSLIALLMY